MSKKRGFNLKREYVKSWNYIKESKNFIYWAIGLFFASFILAFFISPSGTLLNYILEFIQELLEKTQGMSVTELIGFIFFNNLKSSFFGMIFGVVLGIFPVLALMVNGYILGFVSSLAIAEEGVLSLWRILPHGIFELPAIFISLGLGLKFGSFIFQEKRSEAFRNFLLNSLRVFLFIVIPLLIIAGIIEGTFIVFLGN
jgi:stage II sporulation protein M